jgi:hypothetical protein
VRHGDAQRAARLVGHPLRERPARLAKLIEDPCDLARVAPALGALAFELVDLLDAVNRDDDVVVLEAKDRAGVVEENVRVEDVILLHSASCFPVCVQRVRHPLEGRADCPV